MFSVIIATGDSERELIHTMAALVPGATAGIVREVIVADGGSSDQTEQVADIAGCVFLSSREALGRRLKTAAAQARGEWLMFLRPGAIPGPTWIDEMIAFVQQGRGQAAMFSAESGGLAQWARSVFGVLPPAEQGLIIAKPLYIELGGHTEEGINPERALLRRIGWRRLPMLRTRISAI